jgi:C-terminal processing protease CtpA/Prc/Tol biopolymer transport system component
MKKIYLLMLLVYVIYTLSAYEPFFMDDPTISPDGELICFVYMDDLWEVPFDGGVARRLTSRTGNIFNPAYSPDGLWITFHSNDEGRTYFYKIPASGGHSELISREEFIFCDWFPNAKNDYSSLGLLGIMNNPGEESSFIKYEFNSLRPIEITKVAESFASVSKDGQLIAFNRRGYPYRMSYQGSHNGDLWLYNLNNKDFTRLTNTKLTERYPVFSKVNQNRLYFLASDSTHFQLCYMDDYNDSTRVYLTDFKDWSPRDIDIARHNDRIVFEYFNEIWKWNPENKQAEKVIINICEDNMPVSTNFLNAKNEISDYSISKDEKLIVFSYKYDLFAVPKGGGEVKQLTYNQKGIEDIVIMDDNETIYYLSHIKGIPKLFKINIKDVIYKENTDKNIGLVEWSIDKYIRFIYKNDENELQISYDDENERLLFAKINANGTIVSINPGEGIALIPVVSKKYNKSIYSLLDKKNWNRTIRIKDLNTNKTKDILFTTKYIGNFILSNDETKVFYNYGDDILSLDLITESIKNGDNWDEIINKSNNNDKRLDSTKNDWDVNFENYNFRFKEIVYDEGFCYPLFTTDDSTLYYVQTNKNSHSLKKVKFDRSKKEEVYIFKTRVASINYNKDKNLIYYLSNNNLYQLDIKSKKSELISFEFNYNYDKNKLNYEIFEQVWGKFGHNFYDPNMHDQDWGKLYDTFEKYANGIYNTEVLGKIVDEMIGRVNASHTGFYPRKENDTKSLNRIYAGVVLDYSERLPVGIKIEKIYKHSELYQKYGISANDIILSINDIPIYASTEVTPLFVNHIKEYIDIRIQTLHGEVLAKIKPLSHREQYELQYEDKVLTNYQKVKDLTHGKIGYLHIQGMNQSSLKRFEQDFLALNVNTEGMIIDVRGNGGGNIHEDLIEIITKSQYAYTYSRYFTSELNPTPHNIYQKPIVCLIDEDSFSDAEIFGVLFRDLKLGHVIGMPTSGSVIGTGSVSFMDGSSMRMPSSGWFRMNMQNMEFNGAVPDIEIPILPQHIVHNQDPQLDKAIEVLLNQINY